MILEIIIPITGIRIMELVVEIKVKHKKYLKCDNCIGSVNGISLNAILIVRNAKSIPPSHLFLLG